MADRPTGTVTFFFTDIEGSTRLLQELGGDRYGRIQDDHAAIMRRAIGEGDGVEIRTEGDSFFVVFPSHAGAVRAAAAAQQALAAHPWPDGVALRVRMGLHSGEGRLGGDDYLGIDVNRAARIAAAVHGGQVVLSDATRALVHHELPQGVSIRDLGQHRLKDLQNPEHLFDLVIEGLPSDFRALRSLDARPNNLPARLTSFVGRDGEIDDAVSLLAEHRLVTLTGPGGTGKTRLALALGFELLPRFEDGVFFVDLAALGGPGEVLPEVGQVLEVSEEPGRALMDSVADRLMGKQLLLIMDNFEHLLDAATVVDDLLGRAPEVRILVTSRTSLSLDGEQQLEVPPLALPDPSDLADHQALATFESVLLFVERARQVKPGFELTEANAGDVAAVCARLDGLPLAIELAASRIKILAPDAILVRLGSSLDLLSTGARNLPERQRTLRGAIEWSHGLLEEPERRLFARLAAFAGGADLDAVEAVGNPNAGLGRPTLDLIASLVDQSLVRQVETEGGAPRFAMLETIREYAAEQLNHEEDGNDALRRHAAHFFGFALVAEDHLTGEDQAIWLERCDREQANMRAAFRWAIQAGEVARAQEAAGALWRYWQQRGYLTEAGRLLGQLLDLPDGGERTGSRMKALIAAGGIAWWRGELEAAASAYDEALGIARELGAPEGIAEALYNRAFVTQATGDLPSAERMFDDALRLYRQAGDERGIAQVLSMHGLLHAMAGRVDRMVSQMEEVVAIWRRRGDRFHLGNDLMALAMAYARQGRGWDARQAALEALEVDIAIDSPTGLHGSFLCFAFMASWEGRDEDSLRLAGAAEAMRERTEGAAPTGLLSMLLGDPVGEARARLSEEAARAAFEEGLAMSVEEALAFARREPPGR